MKTYPMTLRWFRCGESIQGIYIWDHDNRRFYFQYIHPFLRKEAQI